MPEFTASGIPLSYLKNAEWTITSAQWITAVYHVWETDVIVMVNQTVQTMKMRPNAVSEMHHSSKDIGCEGTTCMYQKCCESTPSVWH